ncbi:MAG: S-layer family protein [Cyanobacteria bacterium P01_F01_bin.143]
MFINNLGINSNSNCSHSLGLAFSCLLSLVVISPANAQITPDNSLGIESSIVTPQDAISDLIEGGAIRDNNLFHSFSEFNVNDGARVDFVSPDGITNILTRVTGNNLSEIFGTLGVDGGANLFLLNPNGIIFGENASLDISGSFLATTAESYIFNNGFAYSSSNPEVPPLLTINIPVGLQFGDRAESIVNQSLYSNDFDESVGLEVASAQNITFLGGDILFEGGMLTAPNGLIEIGSVAPNSLVEIIPTENSWTLDYTSVNNFQDIELTQAASINSSGDGAGQINIQGNNLNVLESSAIAASNFGEQDGGSLTINAPESVIVAGNSSHITTDLYDVGQGANLTINTKTLQVRNEAYISADIYGAGDGGDLIIKASDSVNVIGLEDGENTFISTDVLGSGNAGDLTIETTNLTVKEPAYISSDILIYGDVLDLGDGGDVTIKALDSIELDGYYSLLSASSLLFTDIPLEELNLKPNSANGGNLDIEADTLLVTNSAAIFVDTKAIGDGGNLEINVRQLTLKDGASQIAAATWGSGNAGDLIIRASESIEISGTGLGEDSAQDGVEDIFSSGLFASVEPGSTGNGGNLVIETGDLSVSDGGKIVVNTLGERDAGNILIRANNIEVKDTVVDLTDTRSGINSTVEPQGIGNGGRVEIITNNLSLIDGGSIAADSWGEGNAGTIDIQAQNIEVSGFSSGETVLGIEQESLPSSISTFSSGDFDAGSINIKTNILEIDNQGEISVSNTGQGNSGTLNITAQDLSISNSGALRAEVNGGEQGDINLTTNNILLRNSSISAEATGVSTGGNIIINNSDILTVSDNSRILANAIQGDGGNIAMTTQGYFVAPNSLVSASSKFGLDGEINIDHLNSDRFFELSPLPDNLIDRTKEIIASCDVGDNKFAIAGQGGLPENPRQYLRGQTVWQDLRLLSNNSNQFIDNSSISKYPQSSTIIEATTWVINQQGNIELLANSLISKLPDFSRNNYRCLH